ncbi:hypothetical protein [Azospirillum sp. SYSU D00513]|uniref:hypothetical protein n=1 Tax=Azospirillum sp. SYSU D00513 TaxID=2812561 RepID=UPI001A96709A|nr:hypothetical protein [Azospirillum sp. SYSU D00513]
MSNENNAQQRFSGYVELAALDRPFLSKSEERRLLEDGIARFGLDPEVARGILLSVAQRKDLRVERDIDARMRAILDRFGGKGRKISKKKFMEAAAIYNGLAGGTLDEEAARIRVKRVMEENEFRARRAGLFLSRRWYGKIGRKGDPEALGQSAPTRGA